MEKTKDLLSRITKNSRLNRSRALVESLDTSLRASRRAGKDHERALTAAREELEKMGKEAKSLKAKVKKLVKAAILRAKAKAEEPEEYAEVRRLQLVLCDWQLKCESLENQIGDLEGHSTKLSNRLHRQAKYEAQIVRYRAEAARLRTMIAEMKRVGFGAHCCWCFEHASLLKQSGVLAAPSTPLVRRHTDIRYGNVIVRRVQRVCPAEEKIN